MAGSDFISGMKGFSEHSRLMAEAISDLHRSPLVDVPMSMPVRDFAEYSLHAATSTIGLLRKHIGAFEAKLSDREAVLIMMIGGPSGVSFFPTRVWSEDPDKIAFEGVDPDGHPFLVVQHVSQLNFALRSCPLAENQTRQPIGFVIPQ